MAVDPDSECEGAAEAIDDSDDELDWLELAEVAEVVANDPSEAVVMESPTRNWFCEVAEGECESGRFG